MKLIDVVAACVVAYRQHNEQVVSDQNVFQGDAPPIISFGNKSLVGKYLDIYTADIPKLTVTDQDRQEAQAMIDALVNDNLLELLKGAASKSTFKQNVIDLLSKESFTEKELLRSIGLLVYVPKLADGLTRKLNQQEKAYDFAASQHLGQVGNKLKTDVTIHKCLFSQTYNCYFITAYTDDNNVVKFSNREAWIEGRVYSISGRIRDHMVNNWNNEPNYAVTKISHVKQV